MTLWVKRELSAWVAVLIFAVVYSLGPVFLADYLGGIEGQIDPVVTQMQIDGTPERIAPDQSGMGVTDSTPSSNVDAHATKRRSCRFVQIEFFFGSRQGDAVPIPAYFLDRPAMRGPGLLVWHDLIIGVPPSMLAQVFGDVLHRCHGGWLTRTQFYTGEDAR